MSVIKAPANTSVNLHIFPASAYTTENIREDVAFYAVLLQIHSLSLADPSPEL